jgi:4-hydroxy-2-oxoglutarate aldolase
MYRATRAGHAAEAQELQEKLDPASRRIAQAFGPPGLKYAMDRLGYRGGSPRRPLLPPTEDERREIDAILTAWMDVAAATRPA